MQAAGHPRLRIRVVLVHCVINTVVLAAVFADELTAPKLHSLATNGGGAFLNVERVIYSRQAVLDAIQRGKPVILTNNTVTAQWVAVRRPWDIPHLAVLAQDRKFEFYVAPVVNRTEAAACAATAFTEISGNYPSNASAEAGSANTYIVPSTMREFAACAEKGLRCHRAMFAKFLLSNFDSRHAHELPLASASTFMAEGSGGTTVDHDIWVGTHGVVSGSDSPCTSAVAWHVCTCACGETE